MGIFMTALYWLARLWCWIELSQGRLRARHRLQFPLLFSL